MTDLRSGLPKGTLGILDVTTTLYPLPFANSDHAQGVRSSQLQTETYAGSALRPFRLEDVITFMIRSPTAPPAATIEPKTEELRTLSCNLRV